MKNVDKQNFEPILFIYVFYLQQTKGMFIPAGNEPRSYACMDIW